MRASPVINGMDGAGTGLRLGLTSGRATRRQVPVPVQPESAPGCSAVSVSMDENGIVLFERCAGYEAADLACRVEADLAGGDEPGLESFPGAQNARLGCGEREPEALGVGLMG